MLAKQISCSLQGWKTKDAGAKPQVMSSFWWKKSWFLCIAAVTSSTHFIDSAETPVYSGGHLHCHPSWRRNHCGFCVWHPVCCFLLPTRLSTMTMLLLNPRKGQMRVEGTAMQIFFCPELSREQTRFPFQDGFSNAFPVIKSQSLCFWYWGAVFRTVT